MESELPRNEAIGQMMLGKGHVLELTIDRMAFGGRGIGRLDGFVVFVRGGVPGDKVKARLFKKRKGYGEASIVELIKPSSDRVTAPCPYSGYCGGCHWQHIRYERQMEFKREQLGEAIEHIGGLRRVVVHEVLPSDKKFCYRNKMEFSFSDRRWLLPHELEKNDLKHDFALGLHVPGTYNKVIDVEACLLQEQEGNRILQHVKRYAKDSGVPIYNLKTHEGFWRFLMVRYSTAFDEWMVNVVTSAPSQEVLEPLADSLSARISHVKTVVNNISRRKASIATGESEIRLCGDGRIRDRIGQFIFQISANSFFQTNALAAQKLYEKVAEFAEFNGTEEVVDLYSGTGTIPVFLADRVQRVTGIEINENAVGDARMNCRENGVENCHFICGDIREKLSALVNKPDVLIIDPPRTGMHKDVVRQVLALSPKRIIYISCNPASLARDILLMKDQYELVEIQPVDMFPHTFHIESVAKMSLRLK